MEDSKRVYKRFYRLQIFYHMVKPIILSVVFLIKKINAPQPASQGLAVVVILNLF